MKKSNILKASVAPFALGLALASAPAFGQDNQSDQPTTVDCSATPNDPSCSTDSEAPSIDTIVVTGSISRNPAAATASPIVSVTAADLEQRGVATVAEAIQSLTANGQGTVPSSWSAYGFTTGATAPSLRGFNDAYTLVLFDGMRSATYPLADDTQRNITDTNTIPSAIVGQIDTLLDGASATYGSDAIAGVINIIPKHQIVGLHANASYGISQRGDSAEKRASATYGYGDIDKQGFNIYGAVEWSQNDALFMRDRGYPYNTADWSQICGTTAQGCLYNAIRNGVQADGTFSRGATRVNVARPYDPTDLTTPLGRYQLIDSTLGCQGLTSYTLSAAQYAASSTSPAVACQQDRVADYSMYTPEIRRLGATLRATVALGASSEAFAMFNFYNVKTSSNSSPYGWTGRTAPLSTSVLVSNIFLPAYVCSSGTSTVDSSGNLIASGCDASNGTLNPDNPFASSGQLANLYGTPNMPRSSKTDAKTYRVSAGVHGSFGDSGFDYSIGATYSKVDLNIEQSGYIFLQGLMDAVAQGTYSFADPASNSQAAIDQVFPTNYKTAKSSLAQVQATLAKDLFALPGGNVNLAIAGQFRHETLDNPSANPDNANPNARYFSINPVGVTGKRDIWSAAYELTVPLLDQLRLKADGSYDHYSTGQSAFSPKFEAEFTPINWLKVRGTFSKGFRAPNFNESFQLPATGYSNANIDCTNATYAAFCAAHASNPAYYQGGYSVGLTSSGNPNLNPEKSTSYTFGVVLQPTRRITITADYWHTKISNLIVPASATSDIYNQYYTNNGVVNVPGITVLPGQPDTDNPNALPLLGFIQASFKNANALKGEGLDFTIDTIVPLNENISWHSKGSASYLLRLEQINDDGTLWRYDGTLGQCGLTSCSGAPAFRATWQNTLNFKDTTSVTLTANYTSRYSMVATDSGGIYGDCEASGSAGQLLTYDNGDPVLCYSKPVFYLDGHVETKVADKFTVYMDVLNLLDSKAKFDPNAAYGIYGFNPAWSDRLFVGRYFRVGAKIDF